MKKKEVEDIDEIPLDYVRVDNKTMKRGYALYYYQCLSENLDKLIAETDNDYTTKRRKDYVQDVKERVERYKAVLEVTNEIIDLIEIENYIYISNKL